MHQMEDPSSKHWKLSVPFFPNVYLNSEKHLKWTTSHVQPFLNLMSTSCEVMSCPSLPSTLIIALVGMKTENKYWGVVILTEGHFPHPYLCTYKIWVMPSLTTGWIYLSLHREHVVVVQDTNNGPIIESKNSFIFWSYQKQINGAFHQAIAFRREQIPH